MQLLKPELSTPIQSYKARFPELTSDTLTVIVEIHESLRRFAREGLLAEETLGVRVEEVMAQVWRRSCSGERCQEAVVWQVFRSLLGRRLVSRLSHLEIFERVLGESLSTQNAPARLADYDLGSRPGLARRQRLGALVPGASELLAERALSLNDYLGMLAEQGKLDVPPVSEQDAELVCRRAAELALAQGDRPEGCLRLAACLHYGRHDRKFQLILDLFCA